MVNRLIMKQRSLYMWDLISPKGYVMVEGYHASPYKAEEWVKAYISGQSCWSYVMILKEQL